MSNDLGHHCVGLEASTPVAMLRELFGGLSIAPARSFRVIDPTLETRRHSIGIGASPLFRLMFWTAAAVSAPAGPGLSFHRH